MRVGDIWSSLRGVLVDNFTFNEIKTVCGDAGLPLNAISNLQQRPSAASATKGRLVDALTEIFEDLNSDQRDRVVASCIEEILRRKPETRDRLEEVLRRVGWQILGDTPYPLELGVDIGVHDLPESIRAGLERALKRFRDGDTGGALTSICGMIDDATREIYDTESTLGEFGEAAYHERVKKAFATFKYAYTCKLRAAGIDECEVSRVWNNHEKAVSQAGYVLGSFRRNFADVHGWAAAPNLLVQEALDVATFILRSFVSLRSDV